MQVKLYFDGETRYSDAVIDETGKYRYLLNRMWNLNLPRVTFVMLNPSTADHNLDDPTIRRCVGFAKHWGYGSIDVVNLFAYRATDPYELNRCPDPVGSLNDQFIRMTVEQSELIVLAWGTKGHLFERDREVLDMLRNTTRSRVHCLTKTRDGHPKHPLYVRGDTVPTSFF